MPDGLPDEGRARSEFPVAEFVPVASPEAGPVPAGSEAELIALSSQVDGLEIPASLAESPPDAGSLDARSVACWERFVAVVPPVAAVPAAVLAEGLRRSDDYFPAARHPGYSPGHSVWVLHSDCFPALQVVVRLRDYFPVLRAEVQHSDYFPVPRVVARHSGCSLAHLAVARRHGYFPALPGEVRRSDYSPVLPVGVRPHDYFQVLQVDSRVLQDAAPPDSEPLRYLPQFLHAPLVLTVAPE